MAAVTAVAFKGVREPGGALQVWVVHSSGAETPLKHYKHHSPRQPT